MIDLATITEDDILDSFKLQDNLNPEIFNNDGGHYQLNPHIRKALIKIADKFIEFMGVKFFIHDIILTGSLANYNWSKYSDLDLHVVIDYIESGHDILLLKEFFDSKKVIWNSQHNVTIKNYNVELYVQDLHEKHESTGIYSVLNNNWIVEPHKHDLKINKKKIKEKVDLWMDTIDWLIKHKTDSSILEKIERVRERLKKFRQAGLDKGGEYSYENLVFKYLRRNDYIKKLIDLKTEITDNDLSLKEDRNIY